MLSHRRVDEHRDETASKFTHKYKVHRLVWYEIHHDISVAIEREKTMKEWPRGWKINLIERENLHWQDLFASLLPGLA